MGVINLGTLVEQIRKKLSGSFIKATDYATASKAGIVKIGSGVNVTSDGTISVSTQAPLKIIDKDDISHSAGGYTEIPYTLPADITRYHFVVASGRIWENDWDFGVIIPIETFTADKRFSAIEMTSTLGSIKTIALNAGNNLFRVYTEDAVTAGRITVYLI